MDCKAQTIRVVANEYIVCFLAGQISSWVPVRSNIVQVAVYFLAFGVLYSAVMLWINRNRKQTLLIDHENGA